jgi:hypothetical protein
MSSAARIVRLPAPFAAAIALGVLLLYLLLGQLIDPGFTDFWGYQVVQVAVTLGVLLIGDVRRGQDMFWSWETRSIVVATTYSICLGTAGHFYDRFAIYDKITHFAGGAAVAALAYDTIVSRRRRGTVPGAVSSPALAAICLSVLYGIAWEVYEYLGPKAIDTLKIQSRGDTLLDLVADTAGAILAALLLSYRWPRRAARLREQPVPPLAP